VNLLVSDADGETEGQINWRDITSGSKLSDYAFSLEPGCYLAVTSLYEQVDADHRAGNATVLVESMQSLTAGSGECVDGQYVAPDSNNGPLPGFGFPLTIIAVLGALVVLQRKPR
jgi:PGF-CTERM protein